MSSDLNSAYQTGPGFAPQTGFIRDVFSAEVWLSAMPVLKFDQFTTRKTELGGAKGRRIVMNKLGNMKRGGTLVEGQRIQARSMSTSQTTLTVAEKGNAIGFTEELENSSFVDIMSAASILLGRDMAMVLDTDLRDAAMQSPNVIYANGKTARSQLVSTDKLTTDDLRVVMELLDTNNAPRWGEFIIGFVHPHCKTSLVQSDDWLAANTYQNIEALYKGEIGMWEGIRFIVTAVMPNGANLARDSVTGDYISPGADPALAAGVAGNQTTIYKSVFFGEAALAHATSLPVELRDNGGTEDYGREYGIAWYGRWGQGIYEPANSAIVESALHTMAPES